MNTILVLFVGWMVVGALMTTFRGEGGWLIMMADDRNINNTWLIWPSLLLTWLLWPARNYVAYLCFMISSSRGW